MVPARYDGMADGYEECIAAFSATATPLLLQLVGPGPGRCLDLGCGTGVHLAALAAEARRVLRQEGRFVYLGLHACFTGPLADLLMSVLDVDFVLMQIEEAGHLDSADWLALVARPDIAMDRAA
jgi:hypothetical protein